MKLMPRDRLSTPGDVISSISSLSNFFCKFSYFKKLLKLELL